MVTKNLKGWLGVRVVSWFELQVRNTNLLEEDSDDSHQMSQADVPIGDETFALVELGEVSRIQRLIPEDTVNGEVLDRLELFLLSQLVQHL